MREDIRTIHFNALVTPRSAKEWYDTSQDTLRTTRDSKVSVAYKIENGYIYYGVAFLSLADTFVRAAGAGHATSKLIRRPTLIPCVPDQAPVETVLQHLQTCLNEGHYHLVTGIPNSWNAVTLYR